MVPLPGAANGAPALGVAAAAILAAGVALALVAAAASEGRRTQPHRRVAASAGSLAGRGPNSVQMALLATAAGLPLAYLLWSIARPSAAGLVPPSWRGGPPCATQRAATLADLANRSRNGGLRSGLVASSDEHVQNLFDAGLVMAYSFNRAQAATLFQAGWDADAGCALCAWGVAYARGPGINLVRTPCVRASSTVAK